MNYSHEWSYKILSGFVLNFGLQIRACKCKAHEHLNGLLFTLGFRLFVENLESKGGRNELQESLLKREMTKATNVGYAAAKHS